jgi:hypothetical protein
LFSLAVLENVKMAKIFFIRRKQNSTFDRYVRGKSQNGIKYSSSEVLKKSV